MRKKEKRRIRGRKPRAIESVSSIVDVVFVRRERRCCQERDARRSMSSGSHCSTARRAGSGDGGERETTTKSACGLQFRIEIWQSAQAGWDRASSSRSWRSGRTRAEVTEQSERRAAKRRGAISPRGAGARREGVARLTTLLAAGSLNPTSIPLALPFCHHGDQSRARRSR